MKKFKLLSLILAVVIVVTSLSACTQPASNDKKTLTVNIGTQEMPNDEGIAKQLNYIINNFDRLGYEVNITSFSSGAKVNAALLSGDIDFGLIGTCPIANGFSCGVDGEVIWIHDILDSAESLAVKNSAGVDSVADLKGKSIAVPFASTAHYSLIKALEDAGLSEKDVTMYDMQPAEINAAWSRGDIDAAYVWEPTLSGLLSDGKIIVTSGDISDKGYMTADLEVVRSEFAKEHPDVVKAYIAALDEAVKLYKYEKDTAVSAVANELGISESDAKNQMGGYLWLEAKEQYERYFENGALGENLYSTAQFLLSQSSISSSLSNEEFKTRSDGKYISDYLKDN